VDTAPSKASPGGATGIDLYWIPLGAGGVGFVRLNGRVYESVAARFEHRSPQDLYHTALIASIPEGRFAIECAWPSPDGRTASRGVVVEGPVFARPAARMRAFRYEVRCWKDGVVPDLGEARGGARRISTDVDAARRLIDLTAHVPGLTWGRDPNASGDMWNSNSVISWLLHRCGLDPAALEPPVGGRAPGWHAGIAVARVHAPQQ
jgi:hypothetical protein